MSWGVVKILLTGLPGCGKTTALMRILKKPGIVKGTGFYTEEIRQGDQRKGFRWKRLDGAEGILAHRTNKCYPSFLRTLTKIRGLCG